MHKLRIFGFLIVSFGLLGACSDLPHESPFDPDSPVDKKARSELVGKLTLEGETDFADIGISLDNPERTYSTVTLADGSFRIAGIIPGEYRLQTGARYFEPATESIVILPGIAFTREPRELRIRRSTVFGKASAEILDRANELVPAGGVALSFSRSGSLRTRDTKGNSPPIASLAAETGAPVLTFSTVSAVNGNYSLAGVPAGVYTVSASFPGQEPVTLPAIEVSGAGETQELTEITLRQAMGFFRIEGQAGEGPSTLMTHTPDVTLKITGFNATEMALGSSLSGQPEDCTFAAPRTFQAMVADELTAEGEQTLCVRFIGEDGRASEPVVASILYDGTVPAGASIATLDGEPHVAQNLVSLRLNAVDELSGVTTVLIDDEPSMTAPLEEPYGPVMLLPLSAGDGTKVLYASFGDAAGNFSAPVSTVVIVDTTPPTGILLQLETAGGTPLTTTASPLVTLRFDASDLTPLSMLVSNRADFAGAGWRPLQRYSTWTLSPSSLPQGESRMVYAKVRDAVGHVVAAQTPAVWLDSVAPSSPSLSFAAELTNTTGAVVSLSASNADWVELSTDVGFNAPVRLSPVAASTVTLTGGDGLKILFARFGDDAGNVTATVSDAIQLDRTPPGLAAFTVAEGALTRLATLHLSLTAFDAVEMQIGEGACAGAWLPFADTVAYALTNTAQGEKTIAVALRDAAGNATACLTRTLVFDTTVPAFTDAQPLEINGGALSSAERSVSLRLAVTGATEVQIGESPALTGAAWNPFVSPIVWPLSAGEGSKTIYFRARDGAGNMTSIESDDINVDTIAPAFNSLSTPALTNSRVVTLTTVAAGASSIRLSEDPSFGGAVWQSFAPAVTFQVSDTDGARFIYVQLADASGNSSLVRSVEVRLDRQAPATPLLTLVGGAYTRSPVISLQVVAEDATEVLLSQYAPMTDASWQPYGLLKSFTLLGLDEAKRVYVRVRDGAGNMSLPAQAAVTLDTIPPLVWLFRAEDGAGSLLTSTHQLGYQIHLAVTDATPVRIQYAPANFFSGIVSEEYAALRPWSVLPPVNAAGEMRNTYARVVDAAGNEFVAGPAAVLVDTIAPSGPGILAPALVSSTTVPLQLQAAGAGWVELSEDISFLAASRFAMTPATTVSVSGGDGAKAIYARYADLNGNYSAIVSTTTRLDTVAPINPGLNIDEAPVTPLLTIHLELSADGAEQMQIAEGACGGVWIPFSTQTALTFQSSLDGVKVIAVKYRDAAHNETACITRTITLDTAAPNVTSLSPYSGYAGREVVINGFNFGGVAKTVTIGAGTASVLSWGNTEIRILVPENASVGVQPLLVHVGASQSLPISFNVLPLVRFVAPSFAPAGSLVTLNGLNFGTVTGSVVIGGYPASIVSWSVAQVAVTVPTQLSVGMQTVQLTAIGNPSNLASMLVMPALTSMTPGAGGSGIEITLQGLGFGVSQGNGKVVFAGGDADVVSWSNNLIVAQVPAFASAGTLPVWVSASGVASNALGFEHRRPWVDARYPAFGTTGTLLQIQGRYFGAVSGTVSIGAMPAGIASWSDSEITVWVPALAGGSHAIQVASAALVPTNVVPYLQRGADVWIPTRGEPVPRSSIRTVWTGNEIIVFGRDSAYDYSGARYNPATDSWLPIAAPTVPLQDNPTAVWTGSEMILWAGSYFGPPTPALGARYEPSSDTWMSTSTLGAPPFRGENSAVWTGSEMIVWGGNNGNGVLGSGGRYNPFDDSWRPVTTASEPPARYRHAAVWTGSELIIWGGTQGYGMDPACGMMGMCERLTPGGARYDPVADVWKTMSSEFAPAARLNPSAIWTGGEMILWGGTTGFGGSSSLNTGARYSPGVDAWVALPSVNAPVSRTDHTAVWSGTEMIVFGGNGLMTTLNSGSRYNPDTDQWQATAVAGVSAAAGHSAVWTPQGMIVIREQGGDRYDPVSNTWSSIHVGVMPPVGECYACNASVWTGSEMIVWGAPGNATPGQGGRYNPATDLWLPMSSGVNAPVSRYDHTMIWTGTHVVVWGGANNVPIAAGGRYDPSTDSWLATSQTGMPTARGRHTAVWTGNQMVVWGGYDGANDQVSTGGRYDPVADTWQSMTAVTAPYNRTLHTAVWSGVEMIVWGGQYRDAGNYYYLPTGGRYDPVTDIWQEIDYFGAPGSRSGHVAVWAGNHMLVWGGSDGTSNKSNGGRYFPDGNTWTTTSLVGAPSGRDLPKAVWTGQELLIWGGTVNYPYGQTNAGFRYRPQNDTWTPMSLIDAPPPSGYHTMIWTGSEALIWSDSSTTLGRYVPY